MLGVITRKKEPPPPKKPTAADIRESIEALQLLISADKQVRARHEQLFASEELARTDPRVGGAMTEEELAALSKQTRDAAIRAARSRIAVENFEDAHGSLMAQFQKLEDAELDELARTAKQHTDEIKAKCRIHLALSRELAQLDADLKREISEVYRLFPSPLKDRHGKTVIEPGAGVPLGLGFPDNTFDSASPGGNLLASVKIAITFTGVYSERQSRRQGIVISRCRRS